MKNKSVRLGSWVTFYHHSILEIFLLQKNLEFIVIDREHSPISYLETEIMIDKIKSRNKKAFIRISSINMSEIKKVLDSGADGIILPMVKSEKDILQAIDFSFFPPIGSRSYSLGKCTNYGINFSDYTKNFNKKFEIIPIIEHYQGIKNFEKIVNNKKIKIKTIMVGPYDLSGSLNIPGNFDNKKFQDLMKEIDKLCNKFKIKKGIHYPHNDKKNLIKLIKSKFKFIAFGMDSQFLLKALNDTFKKIN